MNNGAVAVGRCEPRLTHAVSHPLSFAQKKKASEFRCFLFWWEEVDSFNSETGKFTCISGVSAPKQVVQAQRAARCKPRRIHDSQHKKQHRDFSKEVDSYKSESERACTHSEASSTEKVVQAQRAARCKPRRIHPSHKKTAPRFAMLFFGGKRWIRTTEGGANRFTVCSLWPLGNLPTLGAGGRSRTNNLLITNQLLCH